MPKKKRLNQILKIMIFINNINKKIMLDKYLRFCLLKELKSRGKKIARSFLLDFKFKTKTK